MTLYIFVMRIRDFVFIIFHESWSGHFVYSASLRTSGRRCYRKNILAVYRGHHGRVIERAREFVCTCNECHERIRLTIAQNPFRMAFRPYRGDLSPGCDRQVGFAGGRVDAEGFPVSSLRALLQGQEVTASAHHDRVWQGAEAQVPLLPALQQVPGQHIETRHAHPPQSAVSVANRRLITDSTSSLYLFAVSVPIRNVENSDWKRGNA